MAALRLSFIVYADAVLEAIVAVKIFSMLLRGDKLLFTQYKVE